MLVAEDMHVVRADPAEIPDGQPGIEVAGQAADGLSALEAALRHGPDIMVLDIDLPGLDGISVAARLRERLPVAVSAAWCALSPVVWPVRGRYPRCWSPRRGPRETAADRP
ncbi:response regulator [Streptomyces sp. CNQ085]|nr:response regulator [Streptomyces sp. CNQ085]